MASFGHELCIKIKVHNELQYSYRRASLVFYMQALVYIDLGVISLLYIYRCWYTLLLVWSTNLDSPNMITGLIISGVTVACIGLRNSFSPANDKLRAVSNIRLISMTGRRLSSTWSFRPLLFQSKSCSCGIFFRKKIYVKELFLHRSKRSTSDALNRWLDNSRSRNSNEVKYADLLNYRKG